MKRYFILAICLVLFNISEAQFKFGPKLGLHPYTQSYQKLEFREQFNPKIKLGILAGASISVPLLRGTELRLDPAYTMRGRKIFVEQNGWTINEIHHFIEMPVQLIFEREGKTHQVGPFKQIGPLNWYFGIGPNMSYFLGGSGILEAQVLKNPYTISFGGHESDPGYITFSDMNRFLWGLDFSFGAMSTLGNGTNLVTDLKFTYGHTQLGAPTGSNMPILDFSDNLAFRYQLISLSVSYWYKIDFMKARQGKTTGGETIRTKKPVTIPGKKRDTSDDKRLNTRLRTNHKRGQNINKIKNPIKIKSLP